MRLTDEMKQVVARQGLGFVATVRADGTPAVSPKGTTSVWDDEHLVFLHLRSPGTVANLANRPAIEINVVDPILRKGWRFAGQAKVLTTGPDYNAVVSYFVDQRGTVPERVRAVVLIRVDSAESLTSPAYDNGTPEDQIAAKWRARHLHGAQPDPTADPDGQGEDLLRARKYLAAQPFSRLLGTRITEFESGRATLELDVVADLRQQDGHVHGGVLSYLADNAITFAAGSALGTSVLTGGMTIDYLQPARGPLMRAVSTVVHRTRRQATCRCDIHNVDPSGDLTLCATAIGRARLVPASA